MHGWVEAYGARLYRAAAVKASPEEAADLCQEVFLVAAGARFEGRSSPYTWLYGILHNLVRERRRRRGGPVEAPALAVVTPEASLAAREGAARVRAAVARLPEAQRDVVSLFYLEELSVQAVAEALKLPENTVKSRLFAARAALRRALVEP
ncbi:MAG: sigma-70 family RNA polymerase sigma factor [bacterium]